MDFYRKTSSSLNEHTICKIIQTNPHPNIVKIYNITDGFIDMEKVHTYDTLDYNHKIDKVLFLDSMKNVKTYLQNLNIIYIDWKIDNTGVGTDGCYKLFDFDVSGIVNGNNWEVEPPKYWSYRTALENGISEPKEIDDFAFKIGFKKYLKNI
jgi:hypothetical protein